MSNRDFEGKGGEASFIFWGAKINMLTKIYFLEFYKRVDERELVFFFIFLKQNREDYILIILYSSMALT